MKGILFAIAIFCAIFIVSCDSNLTFINPNDANADVGEIDKLCEKLREQSDMECGYMVIARGDNEFEINCDSCGTGRVCNYLTNKCELDRGSIEKNDADSEEDNDADYHDNDEAEIDGDVETGQDEDGDVPENDEDNTRDVECSPKPENTEWNTVSHITQTWNGVSWTPTNQSLYSPNGSTTECLYKCVENYSWTGSECIFGSKTGTCDPKPDNSKWNDNGANGTFTRTAGETGWYPETHDSEYNKNAGECHYVCDTHYTWNNTICEADTREADCQEKPANSVWNDDGANGKYIQTWDGSMWGPATALSSYDSTDAGTCRYKCDKGFAWDGSDCFKWYVANPLSLGEICTGQQKCYDSSSVMEECPAADKEFYGQDAQYKSRCTAQSFSAGTGVQAGTVTDNNTGLVWKNSPSEDLYDWANASDYCNELNERAYGGFNTWRVPNPLEFMTIVDNSRYNPATNSKFRNMPTGDPDDSVWLWTSKEYKTDKDYAYYFGPNSGSYWHQGDKSATQKVLCVSGDEMQPAVSGDFTTSSDGKVVTDNRTGLMWQKEYVSDKTWQKALAYCQSLNGGTEPYAGYTDWRLPNKNELLSLVNYEKPQNPYSYFPGMPSYYFWSSSTGVAKTASAWRVDFNSGYVNYYSKTGNARVRCVRQEFQR